MKEIVNTWKEPLLVHLLSSLRGRGTRDRLVVQLAPGESTEIEDDQMSPEIEHLRKKGRVAVKDVLREEDTPSLPPVEEDEEDLEKLEQELLAEATPSEDEADE